MTHTSFDYAARIRQQGHRLTPQRQHILDAICESGGHTSREEILRRVYAKAPTISPSTIYRNLEFLISTRLVVAAEIGGQLCYEIAHPHPHHHLVCQACGAQQELDQALLSPAFAAITQHTGFVVQTDHLVLYGRCQECVAP